MGHSKVSWYELISLASHPPLFLLSSLAELGQVSDSAETKRTSKTFLASEVSLRLLLFHVHFLSNIGRPEGRRFSNLSSSSNQLDKTLAEVAAGYDTMYGRPTNLIKDVFLRGVQDIKNVKTWGSFYKGIGVPPPSDEKLLEILQKSVNESLLRGNLIS